MSIAVRVRRGQGPLWGSLKRLARSLLHAHIPVVPATRPFFRLLYGLHVAGREWLLWILRFLWYEPLFRSQCVTVGSGFQMEQLPYISGKGRITLGDGIRLSGKPTIVFCNRFDALPELTIGDGTFIGHLCSFHVVRSLSIGKHCLLANGVKVYDYDGHPFDPILRRNNVTFPSENCKPVVIEDDVWVGAGTLIFKGVTIGARTIIGAGSVVTRNLPSDVVAAGNPARVIKPLRECEGSCREMKSAADDLQNLNHA